MAKGGKSLSATGTADDPPAAVPKRKGRKRKSEDEAPAAVPGQRQKRKSEDEAPAAVPGQRQKRKSAGVATRRAPAPDLVEAAEGKEVQASVPVRRRREMNSASRVRGADKVEAAAANGVEDEEAAAAAAATPIRGIISVHTAEEFLQRTADFAPGSVLVAIGNDASLCDASVFWKFLSARQKINGPTFQLANVQTLLHKTAALEYVHAEIDYLTKWHNSLGVHVDNLEHQIVKIDCNMKEETSSSRGNRSCWPLDGVKFMLEAKKEVVSAASMSAAELKRNVLLDPKEIETCKEQKRLPLLGQGCFTSSAFPLQAHLLKEPAPHVLAQKEMRLFKRRSYQIQMHAYQQLQESLFAGIVELRQEVSGPTFLGCGATNYQEFSDS